MSMMRKFTTRNTRVIVCTVKKSDGRSWAIQRFTVNGRRSMFVHAGPLFVAKFHKAGGWS